MKNKRKVSIFIICFLVINFFSVTSIKVSAATETKCLQINNTTLNFTQIIFVDGTNGNDTNGDGSKDKPFKSVVKSFDYLNTNCRQGGAIVIKDGTYDVGGLFLGNSYNLSAKYTGMKITLLAETMGKVQFTNVNEWMIIENNYQHRIKLSFYGIIFKSVGKSYYHLAGDDWTNEFHNCVIAGGYGGVHGAVSTTNIIAENTLFTGSPNSYYSPDAITGSAINCASTTSYIDPCNGKKTSCLYNVTIDSNYNITSTGWKNTGEGTNPDGSKANIGVYGGQFAWGSKLSEKPINKLKVVLETDEQLQLSVHEDLSKNAKMIWSSSDNTVAAVDSNGIVTAIKPGNTVITVTNKKKTYTEAINILVVDDATDLRLAVDLIVGQTSRLTIDDLTDTVKVTWSSIDPTVATVSKKGKVTAVNEGLVLIIVKDENGNDLGQVYVRVRE